VGIFLPGFDSNLRINSVELGQGTRVNSEDSLGIKRQQAGIWTGGEWRFHPRHRIGANYTRFTPSATRTLTSPIQIGDVVFPVGASLSTEFHIEIIPIAYSFSFIKRDRDELAATAGVNWNRLSFDAEGRLPNIGLGFNRTSTSTAQIPLPLFGLRYEHHFSQRWSIGMQAAGFKLSVARETFDAQGELWNARVAAEYRFSKHFAAVGAVDAFSLNVNVNKPRWQGSIDYRFWGPQVSFKARF
jgi:hypothetical protein